MAESLKETQRRLAQKAKYQKQDRKYTIGGFRRNARIGELTAQIEALKGAERRDEFSARVAAARLPIRADIEECTTVAPQVRNQWLERLDSVQDKKDEHEQVCNCEQRSRA